MVDKLAQDCDVKTTAEMLRILETSQQDFGWHLSHSAFNAVFAGLVPGDRLSSAFAAWCEAGAEGSMQGLGLTGRANALLVFAAILCCSHTTFFKKIEALFEFFDFAGNDAMTLTDFSVMIRSSITALCTLTGTEVPSAADITRLCTSIFKEANIGSSDSALNQMSLQKKNARRLLSLLSVTVDGTATAADVSSKGVLSTGSGGGANSSHSPSISSAARRGSMLGQPPSQQRVDVAEVMRNELDMVHDARDELVQKNEWIVWATRHAPAVLLLCRYGTTDAFAVKKGFLKDTCESSAHRRRRIRNRNRQGSAHTRPRGHHDGPADQDSDDGGSEDERGAGGANGRSLLMEDPDVALRAIFATGAAKFRPENIRLFKKLFDTVDVLGTGVVLSLIHI